MVEVHQLIEWLQKFNATDKVMIYDPDMKEHLEVGDVRRRTNGPFIGVEIVTERK